MTWAWGLCIKSTRIQVRPEPRPSIASLPPQGTPDSLPPQGAQDKLQRKLTLWSDPSIHQQQQHGTQGAPATHLEKESGLAPRAQKSL